MQRVESSSVGLRLVRVQIWISTTDSSSTKKITLGKKEESLFKMPFCYSPTSFVNIKSIDFMLVIKFYPYVVFKMPSLNVCQNNGVVSLKQLPVLLFLGLFLRLENSTGSTSLTLQGNFSNSERRMKRG